MYCAVRLQLLLLMYGRLASLRSGGREECSGGTGWADCRAGQCYVGPDVCWLISRLAQLSIRM